VDDDPSLHRSIGTPTGNVARVSAPTGPGMGRPSGPEFTGPSQPVTGSPPLLHRPAGSGSRTRPGGDRRPADRDRPPTRRLPALLTLLAVAVVGAIVVVASVLAARQDVREATAPRRAPVTSVSPLATDRIAFTTSTGSGVLEIVDHGWDSDGSHTDEPGSLLTIALKVTCESGTLRYGPDSFQAFDAGGALFEVETPPESATALEFGTLSAGQQATGTVAFDIPRGGVTLLMSDEVSQTVTALRVPD
jgi:hypothetical protein